VGAGGEVATPGLHCINTARRQVAFDKPVVDMAVVRDSPYASGVSDDDALMM
jgi:hypothetical protein